MSNPFTPPDGPFGGGPGFGFGFGPTDRRALHGARRQARRMASRRRSRTPR